ncbi:hypothetical protein HOP50_03g20120 [Chloropicon primus]|uniref:Uncharacterized protein n=1 Tax=Chloropicon primus TaxID=1764295 RepID=A0A5B8MIK6_9CHLO|nr:hypothetical protein A3770_03p20130 [Chloropicon primus]UPQ98706.1 hypothetical protein HOP50_03g20120 [Chloropicon primus]|eukprot:QDZ19495.1 hypothetical protein A3770_03p20130 [Chloropicon primus]
MGCVSSKDVEELKEQVRGIQDQQRTLLGAIEELNHNLQQQSQDSEGLKPEQIQLSNQDARTISEEEIKSINDSLKTLEKGLSLLLAKTYEPVTKVIERKHNGIRKLTEQISNHLRTVQSPGGQTPDKTKLLNIQKKLSEMETRFTELSSPLTSPR